jgi:hypothetical protein
MKKIEKNVNQQIKKQGFECYINKEVIYKMGI